jgi:hypothetical protein
MSIHRLTCATALALMTIAMPALAHGDDLPRLRCSASDKIDGSTADSARRKMTAAGYRQVRDLKKGCDNYWHGKAVKDGGATNVVLSPRGDVMPEGE